VIQAGGVTAARLISGIQVATHAGYFFSHTKVALDGWKLPTKLALKGWQAFAVGNYGVIARFGWWCRQFA
jgi:hypothetical protein